MIWAAAARSLHQGTFLRGERFAPLALLHQLTRLLSILWRQRLQDRAGGALVASLRLAHGHRASKIRTFGCVQRFALLLFLTQGTRNVPIDGLRIRSGGAPT